MTDLSCLEVFTGAGGLAKAVEIAGGRHQAFIEVDRHACQTLAYNYDSELVQNIDVRNFDFSNLGTVDIVAGGPPCQPFSLGGKHGGHLDKRDMFPYAREAIRLCKPKVFIFENVKGLLRQSLKRYLRYILLSLELPHVSIQKGENWEDHFKRLGRLKPVGSCAKERYKVIYKLVNAANYGVPQKRERVFIIGIREDLDISWAFPEESHSLEALLWSQFVTGDYWRRHNVPPVYCEQLKKSLSKKIDKLQRQVSLFSPDLKPWKTVRDQIGDLPEPDLHGSFNSEHQLRSGARVYPGHTGSYIDMPSKTLKAGDHGVPGGENMIRYEDGRVRYYTIFEAKKIQTFPDSYAILGSWTEAMRQIGNAVPVDLGVCITSSLLRALHSSSMKTAVSFTP